MPFSSLPLLLPLLAGCVTEENFPSKLADASCDWMQECQRSFYESLYSDPADCEADAEGGIQDIMDVADAAGCVFVEEAAPDCIDAARAASCTDSPLDVAACDQVWDCPLGR